MPCLLYTSGIERRIVFHAARHTYATEITLSHGGPLETVSKMLGHTRVDTTQIYAKVTDDKINADTKRLDNKISERFTIDIWQPLKRLYMKTDKNTACLLYTSRLWEDSSGMPYILIWIIFVSQALFLVVTEWVESSGI